MTEPTGVPNLSTPKNEGRAYRIGYTIIGVFTDLVMALFATIYAYFIFLGKSVAASSDYSQEFLGGVLNGFCVLALLFLLATAVFSGFISHKIGKRLDSSRG